MSPPRISVLFLQDSRLARGLGHGHENSTRKCAGLLYQDPYALRTASQCNGPQLEDLLLAHEQIAAELNSTTDNPLIDASEAKIHHGGNFQAVSITSAMEKARLNLQMIGKMLFAQCSELINPMLNNGLPPNLAADEPSLSFTMEGVHIGMASYMSELAYLANPVSSHVQSAEMHNQAINSLAFISTRYTLEAVELTSLMSASYLYTVCQALDLRVMKKTFFQTLEPALYSINCEMFGSFLAPVEVDELHATLWEHVQVTWLLSTNKDSQDRYTHIVESALAVLAQFLLLSPHQAVSGAFDAVASWKVLTLAALADTYVTTRANFFRNQPTADFLGRATRRMYRFVRETLRVPFHRGLEDHPTPTNAFSRDGRKKHTIGSWITVILETLRSGQMYEPLMECLSEIEGKSPANIAGEQAKTNEHCGADTNVKFNGHRSAGQKVETNGGCWEGEKGPLSGTEETWPPANGMVRDGAAIERRRHSLDLEDFLLIDVGIVSSRCTDRSQSCPKRVEGAGSNRRHSPTLGASSLQPMNCWLAIMFEGVFRSAILSVKICFSVEIGRRR